MTDAVVTQPDIHVDNVERVTNTGNPGPVNDRTMVLMVIVFLGTIVLAVIVAEVVLLMRGETLPETLLVIAGVAVGQLGSMLASTASHKP